MSMNNKNVSSTTMISLIKTDFLQILEIFDVKEIPEVYSISLTDDGYNP